MKVLFLGYRDSPLVDFIRQGSDAVTVMEEKITPDFVQRGAFDFLVSYGYLHILKKEILDLFPRRAINLHISYLPWNRGKDPNFWSFIEGSPKGVTLHYLDAGVDTGEIIVQQRVTFGDQETLQSTYSTLRKTVEDLFCSHWKGIRVGDCLCKTQPAGGSFHLQKERAPLEHLLTEGWETPVSKLIEYGRK